MALPDILGRMRHVAAILVVAGMLAWVGAQALPAYSEHFPAWTGVTLLEQLGTMDAPDKAQSRSHPDTVDTYGGGQLTAAGWTYLADEPILFVGWTANFWLIAAVTARLFRRRRTALAFASLAVATGLIGVTALGTGVYASRKRLDVQVDDYALEVGTWLWLASLGLVLAGILIWARPALRAEDRVGTPKASQTHGTP